MSIIQHVTEEELRKTIADAYIAFPELKTYKANEGCCPGCLSSFVYTQHGFKAGEAWDRIAESIWLLGPDTDIEGDNTP